MTNIFQFPIKEEIYPPLPRKRVFYLGYRYVGGMCCQDVQNKPREKAYQHIRSLNQLLDKLIPRPTYEHLRKYQQMKRRIKPDIQP